MVPATARQPRARPAWQRYGFALLVVAVFGGLRFALKPYWGASGPFVLFFPAVMLTAWWARLGPAVLATLLSLLIGEVLFVEGTHGWQLTIPGPAAGAGLFLFGCALFVGITAAFQQARERERREAEARRSGERELNEQGRLLDLSNDAIFVRDAAGRITSWNRGAELVFGYSRAEAVGKMAEALLHPEFSETKERITAALMRDGSWSGEIICKRTSGERIWVHSRWVCDRDATGKACSILETDHDITAEKRAGMALRESEQRFRTLADAAPVLIWIAGADKLASWFNLRWLTFTGRTLEQEQGNGWMVGIHPDDSERCLQTLVAAFDGRHPFSTEYRLRRHDGEWRWLLDHGSPRYGPDGEFAGYVGSCVDVTEHKQAAEALRTARDAAVAASRAKDDFMAMLSHELRTPLNPVLLVASEAANDLTLPEKTRAHFEMIANNVALEARLIDDLLDLNRITRGKVALEYVPLDLSALLRDVVATVRQDIETRGITLAAKLGMSGPIVSGDAVRLRQVFWNLLGNALKFTPVSGTIELSVRLSLSGQEVQVSIRDSGVGMSSGELVQVFEPFVQGREAARKAGGMSGLGLGLTIARSLVERHGGHIRADSGGPGAGTEMIVTLPVEAGSTLGDETVGRVDGLSDRAKLGTAILTGTQRILLVEDHEPTQRSLAALLEQRGFAVEVAGSVQEARQRAGQTNFDLLISDLGLPDGDGHSLMSELKRQQPDLAGIAISGYGMDADLAASRAAGFVEHLVKPTAITALERAMRRALQPRGAEPETKP